MYGCKISSVFLRRVTGEVLRGKVLLQVYGLSSRVSAPAKNKATGVCTSWCLATNNYDADRGCSHRFDVPQEMVPNTGWRTAFFRPSALVRPGL